MTSRLVLASASPRRRDLLTKWGIPHEVIPADVDETLHPGASCEEQAEALAVLKAKTVAQQLDGHAWVLGADTLVVTNGRILGKPVDEEDAAATLQLLSGAPVEVVSGVAIVSPDGQCSSGHVVSTLQMRTFDQDEINAYVASGEPMGKAGSFAIQGEGGRLIESRSGSYSNVVGLPRGLVLDLLDRAAFPGLNRE